MSPEDLPDDPELALARLEGQGCGRHVATNTVGRVRKQFDLLPEMVPALQHGEDVGAGNLASENWPAAEIEQWRIGYFQGAEPVVQAFLREVQASNEYTVALADALTALNRLGAAAERLGDRARRPAPLPGLGGAPVRRRLRPEDFGALPLPPA